MAREKMSELLLFLFLISCHPRSIQSAPLSSYLVSSFTPPDSDSTLPFNHIAINNITGDVYIGARERLYQLDSELNLKHTVDTGLCPTPDDENVNDNKLLVVVTTPQRNTLITCGGCDGYCETRSLTNISHDVMRYDSTNGQRVVTTDDVPTVGAVVLGADSVHRGEGTPNRAFYLFTGTSDSRIPFISKHNLCRPEFRSKYTTGVCQVAEFIQTLDCFQGLSLLFHIERKQCATWDVCVVIH